MKGLILKDIYNFSNQGKQVVIVLIFFCVCFATEAAEGVLICMCTIMGAMFILTTMAMDEANQWNRFVCTMPVTRGQIVQAKYASAVLFCLLGLAAGMMATMIAVLVRGDVLDWHVIGMTVAMGLVIVLLLISVILPITLKYGVNKGRYVLMALGAAMVLLGTVGVDKLSEVMPAEVSEELFEHILVYGAFAAAGLFLISWAVSKRILEKMEL